VVATGFGLVQPERASAESARSAMSFVLVPNFLFKGSPEPFWMFN